MARRLKVGDIVEIPTSKGLAYAQFTHADDKWGALLRVYKGTFATRPSLDKIIERGEQFLTFFPLSQALQRRLVTVVGNLEVPIEARSFPLFRAAGPRDREGRVHGWSLWDGDSEWRVGKLTPTMRQYPIRQVVNDTLLIERIESGWTHASDNTRDADD